MPQSALTPQQAKMVSMTCRGFTNTDIAKELGVARKTIIRWNKLPHIQAAIAEANAAAQRGVANAQEKRYEEVAKSAQAATVEIVEKLLPHAIKVVGTILADREAKDSDRLRASELIAKWGGLEKANSQLQQAPEQTLNLYLANLNASNQN